ncbi:MAG: hemerythrin family protein [Desulfamplus sp.]|nr:hemerythrin family protein [Desulfamplus sp.]
MSKILWSENFSVGHSEIDNQHQKWIEIFNTSHDKMMSGVYKEISTLSSDALNAMREYSKMHFAFEEAYMEKIGYPDLVRHKLLHQTFMVQLNRMYDDCENGILMLNSEIMKVIENWLVNHILSEDQQYKAFVS